MRRGYEAFLALVLTAALGGAFWLFAGESVDTGDGDDTSTPPIVVDTEAAARGETLADEIGCGACHTTDGTPGTGPTWKGLGGSSRPLESGETVIADDAYLTRSIVDPGAQVVAGFTPVMPETYAEQLTTDEITDLVAFIDSLA